MVGVGEQELFRYCVKFSSFKHGRNISKTIAAVFPGGSEKRKSNNEDKHVHGQEKSRPSTHVEGKKSEIH